jgi:hypothetical protein
MVEPEKMFIAEQGLGNHVPAKTNSYEGIVARQQTTKQRHSRDNGKN